MQVDPLGLAAEIEAEKNMARERWRLISDPEGVAKERKLKAEEGLTCWQKNFSFLPCKACDKNGKKKKPEQYETAMLNNTIGRIQQLLRVGFGSAGGEIVAKNLMAAEGGGMPKVASKFGLRVYGVWGFSIIEDFNEILVALDDDIMTFVNCVAGMVHKEVGKNKGAVNKNIGEAFLLTWNTKPAFDPILKNADGTPFNELEFVQGLVTDPATGKLIDDGTREYYEEKVQAGGLPGLDQTEAAEAALKACKAIAEKLDTQMDQKLAKEMCKPGSFGAEPGECKSLLTVLRSASCIADCEHFRVHMGVGLNYGWGIEGAIGSEHKVDASYLSPNVNTAGEEEQVYSFRARSSAQQRAYSDLTTNSKLVSPFPSSSLLVYLLQHVLKLLTTSSAQRCSSLSMLSR
jgi:class 3 adenylate cyclase